MRLRAALAGERGQASPEYVAVIVLVALAFVAMAAAANPGREVGEAVGSALARAAQGPPSPPASARAPASRRPPEPVDLVEALMSRDLEDFLAYRASATRDPRPDYSTDECSAPVVGSTGSTFDFTQACLRHDFGYRNYGRLGLLDAHRRSVDERFLADMQEHCLTRDPEELIRCFGWARTFYRGVRAFGWIPARKYD